MIYLSHIDALHAIYLDWSENYLSIDAMAKRYGLRVETMRDLIDRGKMIHDKRNQTERMNNDD